MDSLTKVSNGEVLPFQLYLKRGDWNIEEIELLSSNQFNIDTNIYNITEFVKFGIGIRNNNINNTVDIKWSIVSNNEDKEFIEFTLSSENHFYLIHRGGAPFNWSIGTYHFEVIYGEKSYYGAFNVKPKNLDINELEIMNELIEEKLEGLIVDYLKYKKTLGNNDEIKTSSFWYLWEKYKANENSLLNYLLVLEQYSILEIVKRYNVQAIPRKIDRKSIQWETSAKGLISREAKFLNRVSLFIEDSEENKYIKALTKYILLQLINMANFLREFLKNTDDKIKSFKKDLEINESRMEEIKGSIYVSEGTRKKYRNKVSRNKENIEYTEKQYSKYEEMLKDVTECIKRLEVTLNNQFWSKISQRGPQRNKIGNHPAYMGIYKIYKNFEKSLVENGEKEVKLPVFKRTEDLYEYFTFFSVIDCLLNHGFIANETKLTQQLKSNFVHEGLLDGTKIELRFEEYILHVIYNEELDFEHEALEKKQMMFTLQPNRKPDIRIDLYTETDNNLKYLSSVVLDAKYAPIENIYSDRKVTKVMEQLNNYGHISRFNYNGEHLDSKMPYLRHPVKEVICLYAGKKNPRQQGNCIIASCGQFIRLAPTKDGRTYGYEDLTQTLFNRWLSQYDDVFLVQA